MWWLAGLAGCGIVFALWWIIYYVGWRDDEPGRHAVGYVDEVETSLDDDPTEILPVLNDYAPDPYMGRLARAVRLWSDLQAL